MNVIKYVLITAVIAMSLGHICVAQMPLRVVTLDYPPYQYLENNEVKGVAADIVKEIFARLQQPIDIKLYPFPRSLQYIQSGEADMIFTFYHKPEREAFADFSTESLVEQTIALFVHEDSSISFDGDLSKLSQYQFGLVRFSYGSVFDEAVANGVLPNIDYVAEMKTNMDKFMHRRFDILPSDRLVAYYYYSHVEKQTDIRIKELTPALQTFSAYIGFSKANNLSALRDRVDLTLREIKQDGTYQRILDGYVESWGG